MGVIITEGREVTEVRISIPARLALNLDQFQKNLGSLAERLGHPNCVSGVNCFFKIERDFLINEKLEARPISADFRPAGGKVAGGIITDGKLAGGVTTEGLSLNVGLPLNVSKDIKSLQTSIANVFRELGCPNCHSGFDIYFRHQFVENFRVNEVNEKFELQKLQPQLRGGVIVDY